MGVGLSRGTYKGLTKEKPMDIFSKPVISATGIRNKCIFVVVKSITNKLIEVK